MLKSNPSERNWINNPLVKQPFGPTTVFRFLAPATFFRFLAQTAIFVQIRILINTMVFGQ
jgi:hypothetical protein